MLCALIAVPAGHMGRLRHPRMDGNGRGPALAGILPGRPVLSVRLLAVPAFVVALVAGLVLLTEPA